MVTTQDSKYNQSVNSEDNESLLPSLTEIYNFPFISEPFDASISSSHSGAGNFPLALGVNESPINHF